MHSFINSGKDSTAEALLQRSLSPGTVQLLFRNDSARSNPGTVCVCVCVCVRASVCGAPQKLGKEARYGEQGKNM